MHPVLKEIKKDYFFGFYEKPRTKEALAIIAELLDKYEYVGKGLYRVCFRLKGGYIFKFPLSPGGEYCNDGEASCKDETYAKGRYVDYRGFVCVVQEPIEILSADETEARLGASMPDWTYSIDCCQVGFARNGTLKAYDFVHP